MNEFEEVHSTVSILGENWLICCNELFMTYSVCCPIWHFCFYTLFPTGWWWGAWPLIKAAWALKPPEIDSKQSEYDGIDQASQFIISFTPWMPKWWNINLLLMLIYWSNLKQKVEIILSENLKNNMQHVAHINSRVADGMAMPWTNVDKFMMPPYGTTIH